MTDNQIYNILIVDDEPLARQRLIRLIEPLPDYAVCAEASNGEEAIMLINSQHPDIVLIDVRMPVMDGLTAAQQIAKLQHPPALIFCTAYDSYAISAFKVQASDYLLKPVRKEALYEALERTQHINKLQARRAQTEGSSEEKNEARSLVVKSSRGRELIDLKHIYYFMADQKYVSVFHKDGETLVDYSLKELEQQFPEQLLRIHRNTLINKQYLEAIQKSSGLKTGSHSLVKLRCVDTALVVSRRHIAEVKLAIEQAGAGRNH